MGGVVYILFVLMVSVVWAFFGVYGAAHWGRDFVPVLDSMEIVKGFGHFRGNYVFSGNIVSIYLFSLLPVSAYSATSALYFFASFLRSAFFLWVVGPVMGIFYLFSFVVNHDFNQSRLSIGLVFLFLFILKGRRGYGIAAALLHYSLALIVLLHVFFRNRKLPSLASLRLWIWVVVLYVLGGLALQFVKELLPRYFLEDSGPVPLNVFFYLGLSVLPSLAMTGPVRRQFFFVSLAYILIFIELIGAGLPAIYFGRACELVYLYSVYLYFVQWCKGEVFKAVFGNGFVNLSLVLVGFYQILILGGNVWRFF